MSPTSPAPRRAARTIVEPAKDLDVKVADLAVDPRERVRRVGDRPEVAPPEGVLREGAVPGIGQRAVVGDGVRVAGGLAHVADVLQADRPEHGLGRVGDADPSGRQLAEVRVELLGGDAT